ncbi:hypothetical protein O3P69_003077 [Scylla paramamosain]|uniref:Uncharacterized protein n=1 Tax=Scylla paramamosain TaxID=85552 RepID=A0AAW0ULR4_SCYPA
MQPPFNTGRPLCSVTVDVTELIQSDNIPPFLPTPPSTSGIYWGGPVAAARGRKIYNSGQDIFPLGKALGSRFPRAVISQGIATGK